MAEGRLLPTCEALDLLDDHLVGDAFLTEEQRASVLATADDIEARATSGYEQSSAELMVQALSRTIWNGESNA